MPGPETKQCRPLLQSASGLVAMAFDVAGNEIERSPERILEALRSPEVQKAIKSALDAEAKKLMAAQQKNAAPDPRQAETVLKDLGEATLNATTTQIRKEIENSPHVKRLRGEADKVLQDFKCSGVGVWVNDHHTLVYIVGAVLALGAGAGLYFAKSGDPLAKLVEGKGKAIKLGKIEITGKLTKFQPSTHTLGASVDVAGKWKALSGNFTLSGTAVGDKGTVSASGKILIPLTGHLSAMTSAQFDLGALPGSKDPRLRLLSSEPPGGWNQYHYRVAAGLSFKDHILTWDLMGVVDNNQPSGSLKATYHHNFGGVGLDATLGADINAKGVYTVQTNLVLHF